MWRITAVHRWEMAGTSRLDGGPPLPDGVTIDDVQLPPSGAGDHVHRIYRARIVGSVLSPTELMRELSHDLDRMAPSEFATFQKLADTPGLTVGDEYIVRMPGPWDGPVRVVSRTPTSFRLVTLTGHLEAGQIEFRVHADHRSLHFEIESWARSGDRFADLLYSRLRFAKEVQLHMWTSVLERIARLAEGRLEGGIAITTRLLAEETTRRRTRPPSRRRVQQRLAALSRAAVNFEASDLEACTRARGWRRDDLVVALPSEPEGPPLPDGSWSIARRLIVDYQLADPKMVRAIHADEPLPGRTLLLKLYYFGLRFYVGVRVGDVYDETREIDGRPSRVFGWCYRTLEGHFEQGQLSYELWKWLDTGEVVFRLVGLSRPAPEGPPLLRIGFRLAGRTQQLRFYRQICRRARRLTEGELETHRREAAVHGESPRRPAQDASGAPR